MTTSLVERLSGLSGLSSADVQRVIHSAPRRYKVFAIEKRGGGHRIVAQPSRELKMLQRIIVSRILADLPVHEVAHGYVRGRGIRTNALAHKDAKYILKMDLENFFPSIKPLDFARYLARRRDTRFDLVEKRQLYSLLFWRPRGQQGLRLCIGAPSSPFISNALMYQIDESIKRLADQRQIVYTRYADDMTFSCQEKNVLHAWQRVVEEIVESSRSLRLRVNREKTVHISRARRMAVTGVTINTEGHLSLGRERKRMIRAMAHRYSLGELSVEEAWELKGLLAFAKDIEPEFARKISERI